MARMDSTSMSRSVRPLKDGKCRFSCSKVSWRTTSGSVSSHRAPVLTQTAGQQRAWRARARGRESETTRGKTRESKLNQKDRAHVEEELAPSEQDG